MLKLCIALDYQCAKIMVQNRTCSNFADEYYWIGFCGNSMEDMEPVVENHRKPMTDWEAITFKIYPWKYSFILDTVWIAGHPHHTGTKK